MSSERWTALLFRLLAALLVASVGLTLFLAAGTASFDGQRLDLQTLALLSGGISYAVVRLWGRPQSQSIEIAFVGSFVGAVYAAVTRDTSGEVVGSLVGAAILAAFAVTLRAFVIPRFEGKPGNWRGNRARSNVTDPNSTAPDLKPFIDATSEILELVSGTEQRLADRGRGQTWRTAIIAGVAAAAATWLAIGRRA